MKHRIMAFFSFFLLLGVYGSDRQIALAYLNTINELWEGDRAVAGQLIDKGLVYDGNLSGLWYLRGLNEEERGEYPLALEYYEKARESDDWEGGDYDGFLDSYFSLLLHLHRWEEITGGEGELPFQRKTRADVLAAAGWSWFSLRERDKALERSIKGMDLYPGDWRFFALAVAAGGIDWLPSLIHYWGNDQAVMDMAVESLYKQNALPDGLRTWYEKRESSLAAYLRLERSLAGKEENSRELLRNYLENSKPSDLLLLNHLASLGGDPVRGMLNSYLMDTDQDFTYDREGDLFPEMVLTREKILRCDRSGDGIMDREVAFDSSGAPLSWERTGSGETLKLEYFSWPYVRKAVRSVESREQDFDYLYPRFSLIGENQISSDFFRDDSAPEPLEWVNYLLKGDIRPPFQVLLGKSRLVEESSGGILLRLYHITGGQVYALEEDPEGEGRFSRQVLLEGGRISAARRDLDGDGVFDLFEYYEKGVWSGYAVNDDGEGRSDFFEDWSFIPLKIWDYDGDSFMDGYMAGPYGEKTLTIMPHREDPRDVGDYLQWERKFESHWYR